MPVRLILALIVGFLVYTVFQAIRQSLKKPMAPPPEKTSRGEDMVQDPECGTYVPRGDALPLQTEKAKFFFCSEACRDKFQARPR